MFQLTSFAGCSFVGNQFKGSTFIGVNWSQANLDQRGFLKPFDFERCVLKLSIFMGANLQEVELVDCTLHEVDFSDADLSGAILRGSDLDKTRFSQTNLSRADFTGAKNFAIDAGDNILSKAKFSLPEAMALLYSLDIELIED